jgi:Family of unknown function (DUF5723)
MKKQLLFIGLLLLSINALSQIDNGTTTATGKGGASTALLRNWDAIGINPSNLGWFDNHMVSIGVFNFGITAQSDALQSKALRKALINPSDTFTGADKAFYAKSFNSPNALNLQTNLTWGAASVYFPKLGGIAVSLRDRAYAHVGLNKNAADLIFNGQNAAFLQDTSTYTKTLGQLFDSTNISFLHYRELNFAYGRRLIGTGTEDENGNPAFQLYGGIGLKILWGFSSIDAQAENGVLSGNGSISTDYNVNYSAINNFTPQSSSLVFNANGTGMAFDAGASIILKGKFIFGASLTDVGSITWKNNQLFSADTLMTAPDTTNMGLNSWDVATQSSFAFANNGLLNYGPGSNFKTVLPSRLRLGAGMKFEKFEMALDLVLPLANKDLNLSSPYMAIGAEYNILGFVKINAGFSGNPDLGWSVPVGVIAGIGGVVELGIATGDILTFLDKSRDPYLSMSFFALRVNIKRFKSDTPMPGM